MGSLVVFSQKDLHSSVVRPDFAAAWLVGAYYVAQNRIPAQIKLARKKPSAVSLLHRCFNIP
jgi:hypothetical protein